MSISPLDKPENLQEEKVERLKDLFPQVFSDGKLNLDALKEELGDLVDELPSGEEHYGLNWPGKRDAKKLATKPPTGTLKPMPGEGVNEDTTKNLIIEGDNLEVLRIMQKAYAGRIKMIYIDPPYNTGNDFVYKDDFKEPVESYLRKSGQADEEGLLVANPKASGRFHSNWLNMMYPRLRLARNLLKEDGVIFVSIDDNEAHNLKPLLDEVFGEENFVSSVSVVSNWKGRSDDKYVATAHEQLIIHHKGQFETYGVPLPAGYLEDYPDTDAEGNKFRLLGLRKRGSSARRLDRPQMYYPIYCDPATGDVGIEKDENRSVEVFPKLSTGEDGRWRWGRDTARVRLDELVGRTVGGTERFDIFQKDYASKNGIVKRIKPKSFWMGSEFANETGTLALKSLLPSKPFDNPKPPELIKYCVEQATRQGDIVLDFFAGSGTTAQSVLELNENQTLGRSFILIQLPVDIGTEEFDTISDITKERVRLVSEKYSSPLSGFKCLKMVESNIRKWTDFEGDDPQALGQLFETLETPFVDGWTPEGVLTEVMLTEGFPLDSEVSRAEAFTTEVQRVKHPELDLELLLCLEEKLDSSIVPLLTDLDRTVFVCRESALSDEIKLQLADVITVKTL